jgi:hypothetical protein
MSYHRLKAPCVVCKRTMLPYGRTVCYACAQTDPRLPRPIAASRDCPRCGSPVAGAACPACATRKPE